MVRLRTCLLLPLISASLVAQPAKITMSVTEYKPRSTLKVPEHPITRAKFPFIDVHGHQRLMSDAQLDQLVREMDEMNMGLMVNLSGRFGDALAERVKNLRSAPGSTKRGCRARRGHFPYYRDYHAFWRMYGLELPTEVLKKVYYKNALRVIPGIDASKFPR